MTEVHKEGLPFRARWRLAVPYLLPFGLSFLLLLGFLVYLEVRHRLWVEETSRTWDQEARQAVGMIRVGQDPGARLDPMGFKLKGILKHSVDRGEERGMEFSSRAFEKAVYRAFRDPAVRGAIVETYCLRIHPDGRSEPIGKPAPGKVGLRMVSQLLQNYVTANRERAIPRARLEELKARTRGLFGGVASAQVLGVHRAGRLTPAAWLGKPARIFWDYFESRQGITYAFLLVFSGERLKAYHPLQVSMSEVRRRFRDRLIPLMVSLDTRYARTPWIKPPGLPIRHWACQLVQELMASGTRLPDWVVRENRQETPECWMLRCHLDEDHPVEALIVSRRPVSPWGPASRPRILAVSFFGIFWAGLATLVLARGVPLRIPLRWSFAGLFFLLGALPLTVLGGAGFLKIETGLAWQVVQAREKAFQALRKLDGRSIRSLPKFRDAANGFLGSRRRREILTTGTIGQRKEVAAEAFREFERRGMVLDQVVLVQCGTGSAVVFRPLPAKPDGGKAPAVLQALKVEGESAAAIIAAFTSSYQDVFFFPASDTSQKIHLRKEQMFLSQAMESNRSYSTVIFTGFMRWGEISQTSVTDRHFICANLLGKGNRPEEYLVFRSNAVPEFRRILLNDVRYLDASSPDQRCLLAEIQPGGVREIWPARGNNLWGSRGGTVLKRVMEEAIRTGTEVTRRVGQDLLLAMRCRRSGEFILAMTTSLQEFETAAFQEKVVLTAGILVLLLLITWVGYLVAEHLILPLARIQEGLGRVAGGDLETCLRLERTDELGDLTRRFDHMTRGLRQRRDLARFVSGTLDEKVRDGDQRKLLTPQSGEGVVLVSDLRGFTTLSETYPPEEIVGLLNRHIEAMTGPIHAEGGRIEQFIGDAVVAFFSGGTRSHDLGRAVRAALGMRRAHDRLQADRRGASQFPYEMGVGIDVGVVMVGPITGDSRSEFAVIGAARENAEALEARSREGRHTRIVVSADAWTALGGQFPGDPLPGAGAMEILEGDGGRG